MQRGDIALTTTAGKQTSVLTLLDELKGRWNRGDEARSRARVIQRFVFNRLQYQSFGFETQVSIPVNVPPVSKNKLRNLGLTWASRLTKGRNSSEFRPNDSTQKDIDDAFVANSIVEYQRQVQNRDALLARAMFTAATDGTMALYNPWDPDLGPHKERVVKLNQWGQPQIDEAGQYVYEMRDGKGAARVEALSIFDFVTSGEAQAHLGAWLLVRRYMDKDIAESIVRLAIEERTAAGEPAPFDDHVSVVEVQNQMQVGPTREAVECYEMWWRPNRLGRLADGLFASVISGKVTKATTFPYEHGELPIAVVRVQDVPDEFYGTTWMEDALPQQIGLNHSLRALAHCAEVAMQRRMLIKSGLAEKWGDSPDGFIEVDSYDEIERGAKLVDGGGIPKDMYELCDRYEQGIDDTAGVSGVASSGDEAAGTKNARLVAYASQIDEQKNEQSQRNLEEAEEIIDRQQMRLWQQFVDAQRLITVIGEDNAISASWFSGAEIPTDLKMYPAPGGEQSGAAKAKDAEERMATGQLDPARGGELARTGLDSTIDEGEQRRRLQEIVQQAMQGQPVQADLTISPEIAVPELRSLLTKLAPNGARVTMPVRALLHEYEQSRQQAGQEQDKLMSQAAKPGQKKPNAAQESNTLPQSGVGPQ